MPPLYYFLLFKSKFDGSKLLFSEKLFSPVLFFMFYHVFFFYPVLLSYLNNIIT